MATGRVIIGIKNFRLFLTLQMDIENTKKTLRQVERLLLE